MYLFEPVYGKYKNIEMSAEKITTKYDNIELPMQEEMINAAKDLLVNTLALQNKVEEYVGILCLSELQFSGYSEIYHGSMTCDIYNPKETVLRAIMADAEYVILVHNHPLGTSDPTDADIKQTKKIKKALRTVDIDLIDHLIISREGKICSFRESYPDALKSR